MLMVASTPAASCIITQVEEEQRDEHHHHDTSFSASSSSATIARNSANKIGAHHPKTTSLLMNNHHPHHEEDEAEDVTECIETNLLLKEAEQRRSRHRFPRQRWRKRKYSLDHVVDVNFGDQQHRGSSTSPPLPAPVDTTTSSNTLPSAATALSRFVTSPQPLCHANSSINATILHREEEPLIFRRVQSTGDLSNGGTRCLLNAAAIAPNTSEHLCPGSPFSAIMDDVSGWLTTPTNRDSLQTMVDFSSLTIPKLFSFDRDETTTSSTNDHDDSHDAAIAAAAARSQQFETATWDQVLISHAPGGVLVVLAAVTMHPLLCVVALVAVGASAFTSLQAAAAGSSSSSNSAGGGGAPPPAPIAVHDDVPSSVVDVAMISAPASSDDKNAGQPTQQQQTTPAEVCWRLRHDGAFQLDWIDTIYPPLDVELLSHVGGFVGIRDVAELFQVFFADTAPFSFQAFQEKRGDLNVRYGNWEDASAVASCADASVSFLPTLQSPGPDSFQSFLTRQLTFEAKTNNNYVGPAFACTTKRQKFLLVNPNLAVLESEAAVSNVPFGDRFRIVDRWVFLMTKTEGLHIASYCSHVKLTGSCPFAAQIRAQSSKTLADVATSWIAMARIALEITQEQHQKQQQLQSEGIEIVQSSSGQVMLVNV